MKPLVNMRPGWLAAAFLVAGALWLLIWWLAGVIGGNGPWRAVGVPQINMMIGV